MLDADDHRHSGSLLKPRVGSVPSSALPPSFRDRPWIPVVCESLVTPICFQPVNLWPSTISDLEKKKKKRDFEDSDMLITVDLILLKIKHN
jgi:hypothetical protein